MHASLTDPPPTPSSPRQFQRPAVEMKGRGWRNENNVYASVNKKSQLPQRSQQHDAHRPSPTRTHKGGTTADSSTDGTRLDIFKNSSARTILKYFYLSSLLKIMGGNVDPTNADSHQLFTALYRTLHFRSLQGCSLCTQESPYVLRPISQRFPTVGFEMVPVWV